MTFLLLFLFHSSPCVPVWPLSDAAKSGILEAQSGRLRVNSFEGTGPTEGGVALRKIKFFEYDQVYIISIYGNPTMKPL